MTRKMILTGFFLFSLFVFSQPFASIAQDSGFSFGYGINKTSKGSLQLKFSSTVPTSGMWLGVTLYAPKGKDVAPASQVIPIKQGNGIVEVEVEPRFKDGTFEAALYTKKMPREECQITDDVCQKAGYRLLGSLSYVWGYLTAQ